MKALIRRVLDLGPAKEGFNLSEAETVVAPDRYHAAIEAEILLGPAKPRATNGALSARSNAIWKSVRRSRDDPATGAEQENGQSFEP